MGTQFLAIPPRVHPAQVLSTTSVCKFWRGHSVRGCPRSCRTFCTGSTSCDRTTGTPRPRPPSSNLMSNSPSPGRPFGASRLRAWTLHAEHSLQHSCLPLCAGSKLNISSPSRTGGGVFGRCRCAPRPDALGWPSPSPRRSHLLARRRTARDSLNGIGRARAASMLSRHELSHRAFFPACTFGLRCRGLWRCVVVVSSRASESVVVCTCVFRTD